MDRKLNVAMTRARKHLIIVGNPELLANNLTYYKLLEFIRSKHGYFQVKPEHFLSGNFEVPPYDAADADPSKQVSCMSEAFERVFEQVVESPIRGDSRTAFPSLIFGKDHTECLQAISYGRSSFSRPEHGLSAEQQVLAYCHHLMRPYYSSSKSIYSKHEDWIRTQIKATSGRVQLIDFGCGPATCGIAFAELFLQDAPSMVYTGIDTSAAMKQKGIQLLESLYGRKLNMQMKSSFDELGLHFWEASSELPSFIIFNISHFFSCVSQRFTEHLAQQILSILNDYPLNKYLFVIQYADIECNLESYKVFRKILQLCDKSTGCSPNMSQFIPV